MFSSITGTQTNSAFKSAIPTQRFAGRSNKAFQRQDAFNIRTDTAGQERLDQYLSAQVRAKRTLLQQPKLDQALLWARDAQPLKRALKAGANVNAADQSGKTALMTAALNRNDALVRKLLDAGANIQQKDKNGHTALTYALRGRQEAIQDFKENDESPWPPTSTYLHGPMFKSTIELLKPYYGEKQYRQIKKDFKRELKAEQGGCFSRLNPFRA